MTDKQKIDVDELIKSLNKVALPICFSAADTLKTLQAKETLMPEALGNVVVSTDKWLHGAEDTFQMFKNLNETTQTAIDEVKKMEKS